MRHLLVRALTLGGNQGGAPSNGSHLSVQELDCQLAQPSSSCGGRLSHQGLNTS